MSLFEADDRVSTATSRARLAERLGASRDVAPASVFVDGTAEDRPSAATRYIERKRRDREKRLAATVAIEESIMDRLFLRALVATLSAELTRDEAEKVRRGERDESSLRHYLRQEEHLRVSLAEAIQRREEMERTMREGKTPSAVRPKSLRTALEILADSGRYDVCLSCGYFAENGSIVPNVCPVCGAEPGELVPEEDR